MPGQGTDRCLAIINYTNIASPIPHRLPYREITRRSKGDLRRRRTRVTANPHIVLHPPLPPVSSSASCRADRIGPSLQYSHVITKMPRYVNHLPPDPRRTPRCKSFAASCAAPAYRSRIREFTGCGDAGWGLSIPKLPKRQKWTAP